MRRVISLKSPWRPRSDPLFLSRVRKEEKVKWPYTCGMLCAVSMSVTYAHGSYHPAYRRACVIRQYLPKIYIYIYIYNGSTVYFVSRVSIWLDQISFVSKCLCLARVSICAFIREFLFRFY